MTADVKPWAMVETKTVNLPDLPKGIQNQNSQTRLAGRVVLCGAYDPQLVGTIVKVLEFFTVPFFENLADLPQDNGYPVICSRYLRRWLTTISDNVTKPKTSRGVEQTKGSISEFNPNCSLNSVFYFGWIDISLTQLSHICASGSSFSLDNMI